MDLLVSAEGSGDQARETAFAAAARRFDTLLDELVAELPLLRTRCPPKGLGLKGEVAKRMEAAVRPYARDTFVTPMAAVAGAVAEEILAVMRAATPLTRAHVNNGGDIALHLGGSATYAVEIAAHGGASLGTVTLTADSDVRGIATSGRHGRSLSLGIADAVTVLAGTAPDADVAATLIANAVDLPEHPGIMRTPARDLQPDSDLSERLVVVGCSGLSETDTAQALARGYAVAEEMLKNQAIVAAALFLGAQSRVSGDLGQLAQQRQQPPALRDA